MILLHSLNGFLLLLLLLLVGCAPLTGGEKARSFFADDSSEFKDAGPVVFPQDPWSVDFPKSGDYNSNEDHSQENKFDDDDEEFYQQRPNNWNSAADSHRRPSVHKRPYTGGKRPFEDEYDSPAGNSYEHHDYDNEFQPNDYHKKPPSSNYNHNYHAFYSTSTARPEPSYGHHGQYSAGRPENVPSYEANKKYKERPYANRLTCFDREETCTPLNKCPISTRFDDYDAIQKCTLPDHTDGICCPPPELPTPRGERANQLPIIRKATKAIYPKKLRYYPDANKNQPQMSRSLNNYDERMKYVKQIERALSARKLTPAASSPEMAHHNFFGFHSQAVQLGRKGENGIQRALDIAKNYLNELRPTKTLYELLASSSTNVTTNSTSDPNSADCPKDPSCLTAITSKYRTPDGTCNNLRWPSWGKAFWPYNRVLNPSYGDGINSPRLSKAKEELPNVRDLSVELTRHKFPPSSKLTLLTMQFGQFIDHDIASAAPTRTEQGTPISCCRPEIQADPANLKHPACFEISVSRDDPFYSQFNMTCMNFVRSAATPRADCRLAPREQLNQPTSFVDASQVYGSTLETQLDLRTFSGGQMLSSLFNSQQQLLPPQQNGTCNVPGNDVSQCFRAGDPRVNENVDLTVLQTVFLREHNRLARQLAELNPTWNDETLYQEAKKIVGAIVQHITYNEFLPAILNRQTMKQFDLTLNEEGYTDKYDPKINPTIFNSFATAGYRLHSTIQGSLQLRDNLDQITGEIPLSSTFGNPTILTKPFVLDGLIYGLTGQSMQELDQYFTSEVTNKLFRPWNASFGLDIFSLNVQRGRDHGLGGYPRWRRQCGLEKIKQFEDLSLVMPNRLVSILKSHYQSVYDIDLYVAGILENHLPNSEVGPTMACLIGEQFRRLKYGDRFWYENSGQVNSFTAEQLAEIKKVTLARLLCDNGDYIEYMQPLALILPRYWWNKKVSCQSELIPKMCLLPWSSNSSRTL